MNPGMVALDTNFLAYAEGLNGDARKQAALHLLRKLPQDLVVLPVQALGELYNVLVKKARRSPSSASAAIIGWRDSFSVADTTSKVMLAAADLAARHQLGIWDAVIFATASEAGCRLLVSEDMQSGFTWAGVTVVNPFATPAHPLLSAMLQPSP